MDLRQIQRELKQRDFYLGNLTGKWSAELERAAEAAIASLRVNAREWSRVRLTVAVQQAIMRFHGIDPGPVDGWMGPSTQHGLDVYAAKVLGQSEGNIPPERIDDWRDNGLLPNPPAATPPKPQPIWPRQSQVLKFYGPVGQNQTMLRFPYPMRLAWAKNVVVTRTSCHEKVHDAAKRILTRVKDHYGDDVSRLGLDLFGGCLNVRKMRGGSAWSMHSWGIAFDFDPSRNQLRWGRDRANFAKPVYEKWFELWEEEGAVSLGRARNFDWMHTQFARL